MRLHPAPDIKDADYIWYANRIQAMTNCSQLYDPKDGWTPLSQRCFNWLMTVPGQKLGFKILRVRA